MFNWGEAESETACKADSFRIVVAETSDFALPVSTVENAGEPGPSTSPYNDFQIDAAIFNLEAGHSYFLKVAGVRDGIEGPYSFTRVHIAPMCADMSGMSPSLLYSPTPGAEIDTPLPAFEWTHPGVCIPWGNALCVTRDPALLAFGPGAEPRGGCEISRMGSLETSVEYGAYLSPGLQDCTRYFWQVKSFANSDGTEGVLSEIGEFSVNLSGTCCTAVLVPDAPALASPAPYEIVHPNASGPLVPHVGLAWENADVGCQPYGYRIQLASDHEFSDPSLNGEVHGPETTYDVPVGLRAATQYWWKVAAQGLEDSGAFSDPRSFFTGPVCASASQLTAPELFSPDNDAALYENVATLHFHAGSPGCIPDGYFVDLQTSAAFTGENLLGEFDQPGTTVITGPLEDCTDYYWRVAAVQDGVRGPFSETRSFFTSTAPLCPAQLRVTLVSRDALCRLGPAIQYPVVDTWAAGTRAAVVGRSADAGWLVITRSTGSGTCFMKRELLDFAGDAELLPVVDAPPLPTVTPTAEAPGLVCSAGLNKTQCAAAGGMWKICYKYVGCGSCACP